MSSKNEIEITITKEPDILPTQEEIDKDVNKGTSLGCFVAAVAFLSLGGFAIKQISILISNRHVTGYGFLDIIKYSALWLIGAFVAYMICGWIIGKIEKHLKYKKKIREWENGKFRRYCSNTSADALSDFNSNEIDSKLDRIEDNLKLMKNRLNEVRKMAQDAKERS